MSVVLAFNPDQVAALARLPRPWNELQEHVCPACHAEKVRTYLQKSARNGHPIMFGYVWCGNYRRYHGSTGPMPNGLDFEDPLQSERLEWGDKGDAFFEKLDRAWNTGVLPQRYLATQR